MLGDLIEPLSRRESWIRFITELDLACQPGGPLHGWVFHGTDANSAASILSEGLIPTHAITPTPAGKWDDWEESEGNHFGTPLVASFFAEDLIESFDDPSLDLTLLAIKIEDLAQHGALCADGAMIDVPLFSRLKNSESDVIDKINAWSTRVTYPDWHECFETLETVICKGHVPGRALISLSNCADLDELIQRQQESRRHALIARC